MISKWEYSERYAVIFSVGFNRSVVMMCRRETRMSSSSCLPYTVVLLTITFKIQKYFVVQQQSFNPSKDNVHSKTDVEAVSWDTFFFSSLTVLWRVPLALDRKHALTGSDRMTDMFTSFEIKFRCCCIQSRRK